MVVNAHALAHAHVVRWGAVHARTDELASFVDWG